jgi:hypothetical protein
MTGIGDDFRDMPLVNSARCDAADLGQRRSKRSKDQILSGNSHDCSDEEQYRTVSRSSKGIEEHRGITIQAVKAISLTATKELPKEQEIRRRCRVVRNRWAQAIFILFGFV